MNENDDIFKFQVSTEEDLRFRLTFVNRSFTGRTLVINIRERDTNTLKTTLTAPTRLSIGSSGPIEGYPTPPADNDVVALYPKGLMDGWVNGEYAADLLDVTVGSATRIVPVRFVRDDPGDLVYGVEGNQATLTIADENQVLVTAVGGVGLPGPANTLVPGTIEMLDPDAEAEIIITGDPPVQTLSLKIPRGFKGDTGEIVSVDATSGPPGSDASVVNNGTSTEAELVFTIPIGDTGDQGFHGWSPVLSSENDGARRVLKLIGWVGGEGAPPTLTGYLGPSGITADKADATDIRGAPGASVGPGSIDTPELADGAVTEEKVDSTFLATILRDSDLAELVPQTSSIGAAELPTGTTAERPGSPAPGYVRFNSTTGEYEGYNGTAWAPLGGGGAKRGTTPPTTNVRDGDLWFSETFWTMFVYLIDSGETDGQWISTAPIIDPSVFMQKADNLAGLSNVSIALDNLGFSTLGKTLRAVADAVAARTAINAPPLPQQAGGVGQFTGFTAGTNAAFVLPAGGTWAWFCINYSTSAVFNSGFSAGVAAGGTTVQPGISGTWTGVCWRIS